MSERAVACPVCQTEHTLQLHGPVIERADSEPSTREYDPTSTHANRVTCDHADAATDDFWVVYRLDDAGA